MRNEKGFTLIELMIVVSIIGILAAIAIPQFSAYRVRAYKSEGYALFNTAKKDIIEFYEHTGFFPKDNSEAGLPAPEKIKGKYVESLTVSNGAVDVRFYQDYIAGKDAGGEVIRFQAAVLIDDPTGTVIWLAGDKDIRKDIPSGFMVPGQETVDK